MTLTLTMVKGAIREANAVPALALSLYCGYGIRFKRGMVAHWMWGQKDVTVTSIAGNHVRGRTPGRKTTMDIGHAYGLDWKRDDLVPHWKRVVAEVAVWMPNNAEEALRAATPFYDAGPDSRVMCHAWGSGPRSVCKDDECARCKVARRKIQPEELASGVA